MEAAAPRPAPAAADHQAGALHGAASNAGPQAFPPRAAPERIHVLEVVGNAIVGGMESCVTRLVERLPQSRYAVTALCPFESQFTAGLRQRHVDVLITPLTDDPSWSSIQMACALIRDCRIDVIHSHLGNAHVLAGIAGQMTQTPVLATIHGREPTLLDIQVQRCTGTTLGVVSKQSYFHALGMGVPSDKLSCIVNGVDTQTFRPGEREGAGLRQQLGVPDAAPLVGFVGRLSHEKGPEVFVRAALLLAGSVPQAHLVLVGEGPMRTELTQLITRFGLASRVHLAGARDDMPAVYRELDVLVSSSYSEAMPLVLMEAMASGVPVIASRVGGTPEIIEHGDTGWLFAAGDFQDLADRVTQLLHRPGERQRMSLLARERALSRFDLGLCVAQTDALLSRLAASSKPVRTCAGSPRAADNPAADALATIAHPRPALHAGGQARPTARSPDIPSASPSDGQRHPAGHAPHRPTQAAGDSAPLLPTGA